ncbi:hypothetical protein B0H13DRAFT_1620245 [Mycena leptocephala]|nr:hypothetical protein B0H13DRAFT_1620245 [Mycena leptocephala]
MSRRSPKVSTPLPIQRPHRPKALTVPSTQVAFSFSHPCLPCVPQDSVRASRRQTLFSVQDAIRKACGNEYRVELFGSTRYGISSAKSDLDMVILVPLYDVRYSTFARWFPQLIVSLFCRNIARALRKAGFYILETLPMATVPIVKFKDQKTGHFVDLNVNDRLGVHNSDLIKHYCQLNPVLRTMIQYIKMWAKPLGLNRPSPTQRGASVTFSSYALVMMTIGFLQHRGLLPNLQEGLPPLEPGKLTGTFWLKKPRPLCCDVRYQQAVGWTPPEDVAVPQLMQDWFRFYGLEFQYDSEMISVRQGGCLQRSSNPEWRLPFTGVMWNIDPFIRTKVKFRLGTLICANTFAEHYRGYRPPKHSCFQVLVSPVGERASI